MKRVHFGIYAFVAFAVLMVSCTKNEVLDNPSLSRPSKTIAFGASVEWPEEDVTRGGGSLNREGRHLLLSESGADTLPVGVYTRNGIHRAADVASTRGSVVTSADGISSFNVWATLTKTDSEEINYFSEVAYNKNTTDGVFYPNDTADEYFWPGSGTIDFVAVANAPQSGLTPNTTDGKLTSLDYTVPADPTAQNDIMVAVANDVAGNLNASVPLTFRHIMTAVNVKVGSIAKGTISSIKLKGVYNTGSYNPALHTWSIDKSSTGDFEVKFNGDNFTSTGEESQNGNLINADNATFLFIPQEPGAGAVMEVEFTDSEGNARNLTGSIEGDIWDVAKTVNYNISISEDY